MDDILVKIRLLVRAELILLRLELRRAARQTALVATAIVAILLAVAMFNLAAYFFLSERLGPAMAGLVLGVANGLLAGTLIFVAGRLGRGVEAEMAEEIRELAMDQLSAEAQRITDDLATVKRDVSSMRRALSSVGRGDILGLAAIGPLVQMLTSALKSHKESS